MGIHSAFLGSSGTSTITAQSASVSAVSFTTSSAGFQFSSTGLQSNLRNNSETVLGNWVVPATSASQWEIRATVVSGETPLGDDVNLWLPLSITRSWLIENSLPNSQISSNLTFEFKRVGAVSAEVTITGNFLSAEVLDRLS